MRHPSPCSALSSRAILIAVCGAAACSEGPSSRSSVPIMQPTTHPTTTVAHLRGTLDVASGTLTFDPVSSISGSTVGGGVSASIYGDQGVTVRIYNSAVVTSAPVAGKKTYSANVGIRNLLAYRIGDEQNVAAPADTLGIYVFTNTAPVVSGTSSPCTCTVTVRNASGSRPFTSLANQPYWYWPELLGAANGGADTTLARKQWVFEADTQVTRFNFDVLVSAAWSAPNESVWKVQYSADSLPDTQAEPRWRKTTSAKTTAAIVGSALQLDVQRSKDSLLYMRRDSSSSASGALMEATFRLDNGGNSPDAQAGIIIDDKTKYIALMVSDSGFAGRAQVGFANPAGAFVSGAADTVSARLMHSYQLRKYGADSVVAFVDGVRRVRVVYNTLPPTRTLATDPSSFGFGIVSSSAKSTTTTWSGVLYQIGQATP